LYEERVLGDEPTVIKTSNQGEHGIDTHILSPRHWGDERDMLKQYKSKLLR
jgi:hypothetical protein